VSVVGYDDIDLAQVVDPALTTVRVPHRRMGRAGAQMLRGLIAGEAVENRRFAVEIIERRSLGPPRGAGAGP
jgi:LacI family transcriptional regulator